MTAFGTLLRAARFGYRPCPRLGGAFVRMSGDGPFLIEVVPANGFRYLKAGKGAHRCWWEAGDELVDSCAPLRALQGQTVDRPLSFVVGDDGNVSP